MEYKIKNEERFTDEVEFLLEHLTDNVTSKLDGDILTLTMTMDVSEFLNSELELDDSYTPKTPKEFFEQCDFYGEISGMCFEFKKMITDWCIIPKEVK